MKNPQRNGARESEPVSSMNKMADSNPTSGYKKSAKRLRTVKQTAMNTLASLLDAGIETAEAGAETKLILEHCLELDLVQQLIWGDRIVGADEQSQIEGICKRRKQRLPLQYCLGHAYFWDMELAVCPGVFIPRADTETLVQLALDKFQDPSKDIKHVADIGTGSGAIAIALARELPDITIVAVDISVEALTGAEKNAAQHGVDERIEFRKGDWRSALNTQLSNQPVAFDAIVSNPPYINSLHKASMQPEVARYEPTQALFGPGPDGLGFFMEFALRAAQYLKPRGDVLLEIGDGQAEQVVQMFKSTGWEHITIHDDLNRLPRVLSAQSSD